MSTVVSKILNFKAVTIFLFIFIISSGFINETIEGIIWDKIEHDFGTVKKGEVVEAQFTVTNQRKDTLIFENVVGSCGCLASEWPHRPLLPGASATIKVKFDSGKGKSGNHYKTVSVYTSKGAFYLSLKANVVNE